MKYKLDITKDREDFFDLFDSVVIMSFPPKLPNSFSIEVWGACIFDSNKIWTEVQMRDLGINVPYGKDIYISGIATLTFDEVLGGEIDIMLYNPEMPSELWECDNGRKIEVQRKWEYTEQENQYRYIFDEFVMEWPDANGSLILVATGSAYLEFDTRDCISYREYIRACAEASHPNNPSLHKYMYSPEKYKFPNERYK